MRHAAVLVVVLLVGGASTGALAYVANDDGISMVEELLGPTDAFDADTDADGLDDSIEVNRASDPTVADTDGDQVPDGRETSLGTDPVSPDTDGDGLTDGDEVAVHETDPVDPDTDADGLNDREEVAVHGTDPARSDGDSDGLTDVAEVNEYPTNPTESDTDGDGLSDGVEVNERSTASTDSDTDGDGLDDGVEGREYGSDPTKADTDDDGLDDGREASLGTDPVDPDTDADGLSDGVEVRAESVLPNADPLRKDVYLELDYMRGTQVPDEKLKRVQRAFANAPVENPDGSRGITLHLRTSDSPVDSAAKTTLSSYRASYYRSVYDMRGFGYFHVLVVQDVTDRGVAGRRVGLTSRAMDGVLVEDRRNPVRVAKILMHELGHQLGLYSNDYRGIDSYALQPRQYPSVMNYHRLGPCDCHYDYSDGTNGPKDFDDWGHIAASLAEQAPNASKVESRI